jgi:hypothetical protein
VLHHLAVDEWAEERHRTLQILRRSRLRAGLWLVLGSSLVGWWGQLDPDERLLSGRLLVLVPQALELRRHLAKQASRLREVQGASATASADAIGMPALRLHLPRQRLDIVVQLQLVRTTSHLAWGRRSYPGIQHMP